MFKSSNPKVLALSWLMLLLSLPIMAAAQRTVTGTVYEDDGTTPLIGATVMQKGHVNSATMTDVDGKFQLSVTGKEPMLEISFVGYDKQEVKANTKEPMKIVMKTNAVMLNDVVVTALGITREQKSLGYAVTKVSNEELTNTVSGNWLNSMNGKVAGLSMTSAGSGPLGSMRVVLRGEQSLNYGANEALFVVDGVPINSGDAGTGSGVSFSNEDAPID
ncbi:MAG: TonB-dependent receptor, partial [Muribaculaceae bacterium]|nr:TonB-dependent receptor [Muribaculaceae bacterium]